LKAYQLTQINHILQGGAVDLDFREGGMSGFMKHNGYLGSVHFSEEDELFYGKVMFIKALVSYEGTDAKSIKRNFHEAVDDYIALCQQEGKKPERPLKGSFNVRMHPDLHRRAALFASEHSTTLNNVVEQAIERFLDAQETEQPTC
jgi:predicted HicB family RNase H-like nuclease